MESSTFKLSANSDPEPFTELTHLNGYSYGQPVSIIIETNLPQQQHHALSNSLCPRIYQIVDSFMFNFREEKLQ